MPNLDDYRFEVSKLSEEDGGGYLIRYPDFDHCISDGATIEEAIKNGKDALQEVISALEAGGFSVPAPTHAKMAI